MNVHEPDPRRRPPAVCAARAEAAERTLLESRAADLATLSPAAMIDMIEKLRGALDDSLQALQSIRRAGE